MYTEEIRSAKRGKNERKGIHNWHPYYAGYSENFVNDVLDYLDVTANDLVLDPWVGSGTTALVCQKRGIQSIGIEINPVMVVFSKSKSAIILEYDIEGICKLIIENAERIANTEEVRINNSDVLAYVSEGNLTQLNKILVSINKTINELKKTSFQLDEIDSLNSFFYSALFRCLRSLGNFKKGRNPTWLVKEIPQLSLETNKIEVFLLYEQFVRSMTNELEVVFSNLLNNQFPLPKIIEGNSKKITLLDQSVDIVITSPPYLTRIDYAVSTKPELLFLGLREDYEFDKVRRATMGAPVIADKSIYVREEWGTLVCEFLEKVRNHDSKAAQSYYLPIFIQYFRDAFDSLKELKRVLKPNGKACLVVQSSYFKDVEAKLGEMYVELGESLGFEASIIKREIVKQHLAHVNSRSSKYVKNKIYYEDAVLLRKRDD